MKTFLTFLAVLLAWNACAQKIFNVLDFGAKPDGVTLDTAAIQKALDECGNGGGGVVRFPAGVYLSQPITLHSETTVELDKGTMLLATTNQSDFMSNGHLVPFISGDDLKDITFTGGGTIDGSGNLWWEKVAKWRRDGKEARKKESGYTLPQKPGRPKLIVLERCKGVCMENITLQNSPSFNFVPSKCEDVVVSNVTILNPADSMNTDGIDPSSSRNVLITRCRIDTGDDNVAIKSGGHKLPGGEFASEDITVTDCTFLHGHGMSIGSDTLGGVRNVLVKNCVFENTQNGIRIKSARGRGGLVENIVYKDIQMTNVDPAVTFTCYYAANSAKDRVKKTVPKQDAVEPMGARTPIYRDIRISNLTATCQRGAGIVIGLPESCISNVVFENVKISAANGMKIENAAGIQLKNVHIAAKEGKPLLLRNAQVKEME